MVSTSGNDVIYNAEDFDTTDGLGDDLFGISSGRPTPGNDVIYGGPGNDRINALGGNDRVYGRNGNDTLYGGSGNDILYGENGNDTLYGQSGNDSLAGGAGTNIYYGNAGADKFAFAANVNEIGYIKDFNSFEGDRIVIGRTTLPISGSGEVRVRTGIYTASGGNNTYDILSGTGLDSGTNFDSFDFEAFDTF